MGFLTDWYFGNHHRPGWLFEAEKYFELDKHQVHYLEVLDDILMDGNIAHGEWLRKDKDLANGIFFVENENEALKILSEKIAVVYLEYEKSSENDEPVESRRLMLECGNIKALEKARDSILARNYHTPSETNMGLTDEQIVRAREYPLEKLIETNRAGYVICPFHEDTKPSLWVKRGYGYCFSCGESCDSIKWLMSVEKMSFMDAVRKLSYQEKSEWVGLNQKVSQKI